MQPSLALSLALLLTMLHPISSRSESLDTSPANKAGLDFPASDIVVRYLPNGLTLLVKEDRRASVASVQVWCASGSIHEGKWLGAGLSHILEHMLFKGTENRGAGAIAQEVEEVGGYINAYTSFDRTVYWIDVPSEGVSKALEVLTDAMMNSVLPEDEYVKEQEVIRREFAMGFDDPDRNISRLLFSTAFSHHPYSLPVIGHWDIYNQLSREDVMEYYRARYIPDNLHFVVVGDVNAKDLADQLEELTKDFTRKPLVPVLIPSEPPQLGARERHEEFPTDLTRLAVAWKIPGLTDPDMPALDVLAVILGDGRSSRLHQELREKKALVHEVGAFSYTPPEIGLFAISALLDPENREATMEEILALPERLAEQPFTEAEVQRAVAQTLSSQLNGLATMRGQASMLGGDWLLTRNTDFRKQYLEAISAVTKDDVQRVAEKYLTESGRTVVSLNPTDSLVSTVEDQALADSIPTRLITLENGLRVLLRQDRSLPLVTIYSSFRGGVLAETPETSGINSLMASTLIKGTATRSAEQLAVEIENRGGSLNAASGNNTVSVSGAVLAPDLALGLELVADVVKNANFPAEEVERERAAQQGEILQEDDQPLSQASNAMRRLLFGNHPYALRSSGSQESVAQLTRDQLVELRDRLLVGNNGVLAVFGDIDVAETETLVRQHFGELPAGELAFAEVAQPEFVSESVFEEVATEKNQAILVFGFPSASVDDPDRPALTLIDQASSDMASRFFLKIREEMGLAYFVGSTYQAGLAPGFFGFYVGTDPDRQDEVKEAMLNEIRELAEEGLTEEELVRAKTKFAGRKRISDQTMDSQAMQQSVNEILGLGYAHDEAFLAEVEALTLEAVREVAQRRFHEQPMVTVLVSPNSSTEAEE